MNIIELVNKLGFNPKRAGSEYKIKCPFHNDHEPSLYLDPIKNLFHCFGCGVGGDLVEFYKLYKGYINREDAIRDLNNSFGLNIKLYTQPNKTYELIETAHDAVWKNKYALNYLLKRKVTEESIINFKIGWLDEHIYKPKTKNVIVLPLKNMWGSYAGYSLRHVYDTKVKYLHANADKNFYKSRALFIKDLKRDVYCIVEGPFDAIILNQMNKNAVAILGNLTNQQAKIIIRISEKIILIPDNDETGIKIMRDAFIKFVNLGYIPEFSIINPKYKDVNEAYLHTNKFLTRPMSVDKYILYLQKLHNCDYGWATRFAHSILDGINTIAYDNLYDMFIKAKLISPGKYSQKSYNRPNIEIEAILALDPLILKEFNKSIFSQIGKQVIADILDGKPINIRTYNILNHDEAYHYLRLKELASSGDIDAIQELHKLEWEFRGRL